MEYSCQVMAKCAFPLQLGYLEDSHLLLFLGVCVCVGVHVGSSHSLCCVQRTEIQVGNRKTAFF